MIRCQICQHENPEGAEYCEDCGASLVASSSSPVATSAPAPTGTPPTPLMPHEAPASEATGQDFTSSSPTVNLHPQPPVVPPPSPAPAVETPAPVQEPPPAVGDVPSATPPPAPPVAGQPRLIGRRFGADSGEVYPLMGERLVVGRFDPESGPVDIDLSQALEAANVSRHHAEVYRESDGRWFVKDLGAVNGVFIKTAGSSAFGPRLTAPQALQNGDEVAFGNARFVFRTD